MWVLVLLMALSIGLTIAMGLTSGLGLALGTGLGSLEALFCFVDMRNGKQDRKSGGTPIGRAIAHFDGLEVTGLNATAIAACVLYGVICISITSQARWSAQFWIAAAYGAAMIIPCGWWLLRSGGLIVLGVLILLHDGAKHLMALDPED